METFFDTILFRFAGTAVTGRHLVEAIAVLAGSFLITFLVNRWIVSVFKKRGIGNDEDLKEYTRSIRIIILLIGVAFALHVVGFKLTALFAAGGILAFVAGFALKNVLESYVSGVTLKFERNIRRGDVIVLNGEMGRVKRIGPRSSRVHLFDGSVLVVPNTQLIQTTIQNITLLAQGLHRISARVGVSYSSDMKQVMEVLTRTAAELDWRSSKHDPWIVMKEFGDSAVIFDVYVWIEEATTILTNTSMLHEAVWDALKGAGIVIAYPQLDVHVAEPMPKVSG